MAIMSDSSIRLKPVIDETSKPMPSPRAPSSSSRPIAKLFSCPRMSVNHRRMNSTPSSSTRRSVSSGAVGGLVMVAICRSPLLPCRWLGGNLGLGVGLEDLLALLARTDADRFGDGKDEDLSVADVTRPGVLEDRLDYHRLVLVLNDDLELQLRSHVDGQGRAAIGLDDPLLAPGALDLADRERGESPLEQLAPDRLERLVTDVRRDHLHRYPSFMSRPAARPPSRSLSPDPACCRRARARGRRGTPAAG